ncbi:MAG: hypothetical protein GY867_00655 [bacterium]|nr:hypothetical protein [bacterium]
MTSKDIKNVGIACSLQVVIAAPAANAQVEVLTTNPIVGGSTLEQVKPVRKDSVELQFPSGFTCSVSGGDGPSLSFYSDAGGLDGVRGAGISGLRAGVALVIPLYRSKSAVCDRPQVLNNALNELELAERLVDAGAMTPEEFRILARRVKQQALGLP